MKSKTNYFDIKIGDEVVVLEFVSVEGNSEQKLDYYKVLPSAESKRVHYLFAFELESI